MTSINGPAASNSHDIDKFQSLGQGGATGWWRPVAALLVVLGAVLSASVGVRFFLLDWAKTVFKGAGDLVHSAALLGLAVPIFAAASLALMLSARYLHRRAAMTLFTAAPVFRWSMLARGFVATALLSIFATLLVTERDFSAGLLQLSPLTMLAVVVSMAAGFLLQATCEELFFRGWLLQVAWSMSERTILAAGISIAAFTLAHIGYGIETALFSLIFSIVLTVAVLKLGGLEFAIGAHWANNLVIGLTASDLGAVNDPSAMGFDFAELAASLAVALLLIGYVLKLARSLRSQRLHRMH